MSLKLLKRSLDILEEDATTDKKSAVKPKSLAKDGRINKPGGKMPTEHKNLSLKFNNKEKRNIEHIRKEILPDQNKTNLNLKRLLALSQNTIATNDAKKILKRNNKSATIKAPKKRKAVKSIFTEEDFLAFEREYFPTNS
ncbi:active regulator of SIRT1-like [Anastrepha obliqua]|uniref:active regulator of SIRT1-like n=1 Tax=Anastrepha obliqua TaxID=95512 RepID=UPI00240A822A|nr:active regulator of SIRT1-like [Anastrepha obliqua]